MKPLILLSLLALAGCSGENIDGPVGEVTIASCSHGGVIGYMTVYERWHSFKPDNYNHAPCIPCSQAVSPEARFVCFGVTYTAKP